MFYSMAIYFLLVHDLLLCLKETHGVRAINEFSFIRPEGGSVGLLFVKCLKHFKSGYIPHLFN